MNKQPGGGNVATESDAPVMSRRSVIGALSLGGAALAAGLPAPAIAKGTNAGRSYRAYVKGPDGIGVRKLRLKPIRPDEIVVRTHACQPKYTLLSQVFKPHDPASPPITIGHTVVGIVEEVGSQVQRVRVGDRICATSTPQCGQCAQCIIGRVEYCQWLGLPPRVIATLDGVDVVDGGNGIAGGFGIGGGLAELSVVQENSIVPIFSDISDIELALIGDTVGVGFASPMLLAPVQPGTDVVVMGCGPIGLAAVQAARLCGAAEIVAIEPVRYRREMAAKMGATVLVDPNQSGDGLVEQIREMFTGPTRRPYQGGRLLDFNKVHNGVRDRGPDLTISTVGADRTAPKVEAGPDPTGLLPMRQALEFTRTTGDVIYLGAGYPGDVSMPAGPFANYRATRHSGQMGGMHPLRDIPRFIRLVEKGRLDVKSLATHLCNLDGVTDAFQRVADRTTVAAVCTI